MDIRDGFIDTIGNTPLIRLKRASEVTGCEILGKAEFLNPGGSVKDRAALFIVLDAEKRGTLKPGGVIVEGTAGNTGIGLALVGMTAVVGESVKKSFLETLDDAVEADYFLQSTRGNFDPTAGFPNQVADDLEQLDELDTVVRYRFAPSQAGSCFALRRL